MKPSTTLGRINKKTINRMLELSNKVYLNYVLFQTYDDLIKNNKILYKLIILVLYTVAIGKEVRLC